jgi:hypothetical protein
MINYPLLCMLHTLLPGITNYCLNNFILDPLDPEPIAVHMGYLYPHVDGPIRIRHTINPAHPPLGLKEKITMVQPCLECYILTRFKAISAVDLDAESLITHILGLALERMAVKQFSQALSLDGKCKGHAL